MADETLQFTVKADTADLESSLANIVAGLGRVSDSGAATGEALSAGLTAGAGAAERLTASTEASGAALTEAATEAGTFGEALEAIGAHARTVAIGLEAMGLSAEGSAAKVTGMVEAFSSIGNAVPQLLLIAGAFAAVFGAITFLKDAAGEAETFQANMERLGAAVQAQGGDWAANREAVQEWIEQEALASGIASNQLLPALNSLVSAGNSLADSQKILGVAEEVATQKNISVADATHLLIAAEAGRAQGLVKLDTNLKTVVDTHGHMSQVLGILHHDMSGAIDDATSAEMQHRRLGVEIEAVSEKIGSILLPIMANLSVSFIGALKNAQELGQGIGDVFSGIVSAIAAGATAAMHFAEALADFAKHDYASAGAQFGEASKSWSSGMHGVSLAIHGVQEAGDELFGAHKDAYTVGMGEITDAVKKHMDALNDLTLQHDGTIGRTPKAAKGKSGSGSGSDQNVINETLDDYAIPALDQYRQAQSQLDDALKAAEGTLVPYKSAVVDATTVEAENAAKKALLQQQTVALTAEHALLNNAVAEETQRQSTLSNEIDAQQQVVLKASQAHDAFAQSVGRSGPVTADQKIKIHDLQQAYADAKSKLDDLNKAQDENTSNLEKNTQALQANIAKIAEAKNAHDAFLLSLDRERIANQLKLQDEENTYQKSLAQQMAYWQAQLAGLDQNNSDNYERIKAVEQHIYDIQEQAYKQQIDLQDAYLKQMATDRQKALDQAKQDFSTFLDDILVKHTSFADAFKSLWDSIEKQFLQTITQMITGGQGFASFFSSILGGGGSSGSNASGGLGSLFGGLFGGGQASSSNSSNSNSLSATLIQGLTGTPTGVSPTSLTAAQNTNPPGSSVLQPFSGGPTSYGQAFAQSALQGAMLGDLTSSLTGGNSTYGSIGGSIGDLAGTLIGGPVGGLVGGAIGGLLGGLFGPSWGPPSNYPDRSDTQRYGTIMADLFGTSAPNGQQFVEDSTTLQDFQGASGAAGVERLLAQGQAAFMAATGATAAQYQQYLAMFGANADASGSGNLQTPTANVGILSGVGDGGSGASGTYSYLQYGQALQAIEQGLQNSGATSSSRVYQITHSAPDFETGQIAAIGSFTEAGGYVPYSYGPGSVGSGGPTLQPLPNGPVIVINNQNGLIVGSNGIQELAQRVQQAINYGRYNNYNNINGIY